MSDPSQPADEPNLHPRLSKGVDGFLSVQRPVVIAHLKQIRRMHPDADPERLIRILEHRYLAAITTGGAAVGAASVVPAVGVGISLALSGVETVGFLEATALFAQSITELHGIALDDPERARILVMGMMLGTGGAELLTNLVGQAARTGATRSAFWGSVITKSLPQAAVGPAADHLKGVFLRHFAKWTGGTAVGRLAPFGIGAVIGGAGNLFLGRQVVRSGRLAFGPAPAGFPEALAIEPAMLRVRVREVGGRVVSMPARTVLSITRLPRRLGKRRPD